MDCKLICHVTLFEQINAAINISCVYLVVFKKLNAAASKKMKAPKQDPDSVEALEGLDALANLAIQERWPDGQVQFDDPNLRCPFPLS